MIRDWGPLSEMGISNPSGAWLWDSKQQTSEAAECRGRVREGGGLLGPGDHCFSLLTTCCWAPAGFWLQIRRSPIPTNYSYIGPFPTSHFYFQCQCFAPMQEVVCPLCSEVNSSLTLDQSPVKDLRCGGSTFSFLLTVTTSFTARPNHFNKEVNE